MDTAANPSPGFQRNPGRRITVEPFDGVVTVSFAEAIVASSNEALVLREEDYPPVFYIPFKDVYFDFLKRTDTSTHCPYKGNASYWSASASGDAEKDVMWAYKHPYDEMIRIKDHGAFYPNKVTIDANPA
ncbi:Uncharacterized conserved protein, DUF427 family [Mesorhizobium albiziae]|uniref:Uncharacterized conserved protein, DUF427 family n=1 Tax=Neomesorhizobium albiziae TaxID=335020 RepID=A0A1I4FAM8_9HYPH|nr:DUF427 domain-containing protein [Mesorhizobium albiziae]GLS30708.1 hypothetical protein GCM10007937_24160 [Mesorhizobium albiziae]SFL14350.1 Uncharacterized conserved protein, DUF427 family [Mesorhizobium albiziae]